MPSHVRPDEHAARRNDLGALARDVLVPPGPADQPLQPRPGLEPVDALQEPGPLVGGPRLDAFDLVRLRDVERAACVPDDPVLPVERLEPARAQQLVVALGQALRHRLDEEHVDPGPLPDAEDLVEPLRLRRLEHAEPDRTAEVPAARRRPADDQRLADADRPDPGLLGPFPWGRGVQVLPRARLGRLDRRSLGSRDGRAVHLVDHLSGRHVRNLFLEQAAVERLT